MKSKTLPQKLVISTNFLCLCMCLHMCLCMQGMHAHVYIHSHINTHFQSLPSCAHEIIYVLLCTLFFLKLIFLG